ncbi:amino acid ABC transporter substrate-binding protein [Kribbella sandramycini]|uniref:ABC-type branched-subunit amino acid transport system substrate-binding protein n=1 Tax=Kribbella sandramycini TaxID=60450 RepID=A0A7Y4KZ80_9ACTN|nr:ABC transporter substrate-binding protein [Kribbella sandramycini]MBB6569534.1 ABC-type branched-subunit amino acid transport system substrate-binding protein [Kribbella sandramycini]NOL40632.1 amino acid ABC transporter substrate-binding protein [Kribbella sandramycini]
MPTAGFENCRELFSLVRNLVQRPRKGESPEKAKSRDGLPVLRLVGSDRPGFGAELDQVLAGAGPGKVLREDVDVAQLWADVRSERRDMERDGPGWQEAEAYRRLLVKLAEEFSAASNATDLRITFRRFSLVNWLLESTHTRKGLDDPHERRLIERLRNRELLRGPLWTALRGPGSEVLSDARVPFLAKVLALYVFPAAFFRAWRVLGPEYRWLLHQPHMAPADPGTFSGFALRLAQPRKERENPEQIAKLMINAFLTDLRSAYRRRFWRRRAWRRTTYCVAYLDGASADNCGDGFIRTLINVRNEIGSFDPLLLVAGTPRRDYDGSPARRDPARAYDNWVRRFAQAKRSRRAADWYLPLDVPAAPRQESAEPDEAAYDFSVPQPPRWASRRATVAACVVGALLAGGLGLVQRAATQEWERAHCDLSSSHPDAQTLRREVTGECIGIAPHGYAFGIPDTDVRKTLTTIADLNAEAERIHAATPQRRVVTLVHVSALLGGGGRQYAREALQGVASAQRRQLDKKGESDPVLRILPASAGSGMRFGPTVVGLVAELLRDDPTIVGVTGLDQSRQATIATIHALTRVGLPMVATTLSADILAEQSPLYYQVGPQNRREAAIAAAYSSHVAQTTGLARSVRVVYSSDPTDEYSKNLRDDAAASFGQAGFAVQKVPFVPSPAPAGLSGPGARSVGEAACGYPGMIFFAGRSEDFAKVLEGANDVCGSTPPRKLFPEECEKVKNSSLDGHAALAFDAVNLFLKAIGQLQDSAPGTPLTAAAVWHGLSSIHGKAALDGESGKIDFGGRVDQNVPLDKLVSVQHIEGQQPPRQVGFCGKRGNDPDSPWCPPS